MSSFLGKIKNILNFKTRGDRRKFLSLFLLFFLLFFVINTNEASAAFGWVTDTVAAGIGSLITLICWAMAKLFIGLTIFATNFFITIASYNDFINSKTVILGWVLVRDVVNMFFVLILLVIAFGTVLGLEQYEWKKLLVKLVFAAVLVNFSRLICGVIIDAAQVFTMTFVNGFAATAGGNVINALKLQKGWLLSTQAEAEKINDISYLIAAVATVFFSVISFFVLGAYMVIMLYRVVVLWVLIILSPVAFISSVLPATQKYATEWWKEFNNHVLAGPILAFFFWLSFAVAGSGEIYNEEFENKNFTRDEGAVTQVFSVEGASSGINEMLEWPTMASFAIAIALLMVGVEKTQQLGVRGAGALSSAMSTAKKVAMTASGVAALGWGVKKTWGGIKNEAVNIGGDLKDMAQLRGLAFLERSYDKEKLTGEKGFWANRADKYMEREKLRAARKKQLDTRKGIFDSQVGTLATFEAKKETELLKYNLQQREKLKEAGMPAILQEVEGKFRQNDAHKIIIDELNTKQREANQINKQREQLVKGEQDESEKKWREGIEKQRTEGMVPIEKEAKRLEEEAGKKEGELSGVQEEYNNIDNQIGKKKEQIKELEDFLKDPTITDEGRAMSEGFLRDYKDELKGLEKLSIDKIEGAEKLEVEIESLKAQAGNVRIEGKEKVDKDIAAGDKEFARIRDIAGKGIELSDEEIKKQQIALKDTGDAYRRSGDPVRGDAMEASANNLAIKKDAEILSNLTPKQLEAAEKGQVKAIAKVEMAISKATDINTQGYKDLKKELAKLYRGKAALASYNASVGGENSRDTRVACLNETGFFAKEGEINMENRDRAVLTQLLGSYVEKGKEEEGKDKLRDRFSSEGEYQSFLGTLANNFKKASMSGDFTGVGLISEEIDRATGKLIYAWREKPSNDFSYAIERGKADKLTTLGSVNADGIMCGIGDEVLKYVDSIFKGKSGQALGNKDFTTIFASINEAAVNKSNVNQFEKLVNTLLKSVKEGDGKKVLEQRIKILTDKIDKAKRS